MVNVWQYLSAPEDRLMKENNSKNFKSRFRDFAREKPLSFTILFFASAAVLFWVISSLELMPEFTRLPRLNLAKSTVIEQGDSYNWVGMQVVPLSRSIRREFKIPRRIKGMFVLNEGVGPACKYGVKTGDVIISISRRPVPDAKSFVNAADTVRYQEGILLDIYRDGKYSYLTVPFEYQYGPLWGPYKGGWQLGSPVLGQALPYGPLVDSNVNNGNR